MRSVILSAVALPAMVLAGCGFGGSETDTSGPVWSRTASVEAIGRAYIEVLPNRGQFSVTFEARNVVSEDAVAEAVARANSVTQAMREIDGDNIRITSDLSVSPYYEQVTQATGEFTERLVENRHPDALLGYTASVTIDVIALDLEHLADVRGAAMAAGPARSRDVQFSMQPSAELYREAFAAAVDDATERARIVAESAGGQLGPVQILLEGQQPCLRPPATPAGLDNGDYRQLGRNEDGDRVVVTGSRIRRSDTAAPSPITNVSGESLAVANTIDPRFLVAEAGNFALAADFEPMRFETQVCAVFAVE
ncbi:SIMPL domain-containing protein [Maricaulis sp.]|uniref:SIMPL domain-containing protein n=1 Tax=Maricaulis sp. TaxID=1486257 RepID=UPI002B2753DD|nr:SIMPL domain-containing protein [Maricaulis sp.]